MTVQWRSETFGRPDAAGQPIQLYRLHFLVLRNVFVFQYKNKQTRMVALVNFLSRRLGPSTTSAVVLFG